MQSLEIIYFIDFFLQGVSTHFYHKRAAISKKQPKRLDLKTERAKI